MVPKTSSAGGDGLRDHDGHHRRNGLFRIFWCAGKSASGKSKNRNDDLAAKESEARSLALDAEVQATRATELAEKQ